MPARAFQRTVRLGAVLVALLITAAHCTPAAADVADDARPHHRAFRCSRPFSALRSFSPKSMVARENCAFGRYMYVEDAAAEVGCGRGDDGSRSCNVALRVQMRALDQDLDILPASALGSEASVDGARYTMSLHTPGGGSIKYNGFDDTGYSVCCAMAEGAVCDWVGPDGKVAADSPGDSGAEAETPQPRSQVVNRCPLHPTLKGDVAAIESASRVFSGVVRRPLHVTTPGRWEARVTFYDRTVDSDAVIGRLTIPFEVPEDDALPQARGSQDAEFGAVALMQ